MNTDITKLCADSLRSFAYDTYGVKLKSGHAHELVAAFFGYRSRAALKADKTCPISHLRQANIIVLAPTGPIDQRRQELEDLSPDLPDTYTLTEGVYSGLIAEKWLLHNPWPTHELLANFLADDYLRQHNMEKVYHAPVRQSLKVEREIDYIHLTVFRFYQIPRNEVGVHEANITTSIKLPRVAGHIGYANPQISVESENLGIRI